MTTRRMARRATGAATTGATGASTVVMLAAGVLMLLNGPGGVSAQKMLMARPMMPGNQPGVGGMVNLPWMSNDGKGQMWRVYQNGALQNQGPTTPPNTPHRRRAHQGTPSRARPAHRLVARAPCPLT